MENIKLFIPVILATGREERMSEHAANFVLKEAEAHGLETQLIDVRDFSPKYTERLGKETNGEIAKEFSDIISRADGLVIVSPEYNHSYPGELKLMIDQLYVEYNHKPVGICGTGGGLGGARMVEQLRTVLIELQMVPIRNAIYFSSVSSLFDESGNIKEPDTYKKRIKGFFDELEWYSKALKVARESQ